MKADLWRNNYFQEKAVYTWVDAVMRWLDESQHKRSIRDDKAHLRWLDSYLAGKTLPAIDRDFIDKLAKTKEKTGVTVVQ